jgi:uncharacterized membrane protein
MDTSQQPPSIATPEVVYAGLLLVLVWGGLINFVLGWVAYRVGWGKVLLSSVAFGVVSTVAIVVLMVLLDVHFRMTTMRSRHGAD